MSDEKKASPFSRTSLWFLISRSLGLFLLTVPVVANVAFPDLMQRSDFLMTFYVAGHLVAGGQPGDLYPDASATSLLNTRFNVLAHQLLPALPPDFTAIYMYSPLTAYIFAPLSGLPQDAAAIVWQLISIAALALCSWMASRMTGAPGGNLFWMSTLFLPVIHTVAIGQLGIVLGLLPLTAGLYLLMRGKPMAAGAVWSCLVLKPQYLPAVFLIAGALLLTRRAACALGLISGMVALTALTCLAATPDVFMNWLHSFRLSDTIFSDPIYRYPSYLVCSLPGVLVHIVPEQARQIVKLATYSLAALTGLVTLLISAKMIRSRAEDYQSILPFIFLLGMFVLPLVLPHLLTYDLCVFVLAGMLVFGYKWSDQESLLRRDCLTAWLAINVYQILWLLPNRLFAQPLILVLGCAVLFGRMIFYGRKPPQSTGKKGD